MDVEALMAQLGGMGAPESGAEGAPPGGGPLPQGEGNWLVDAINAVHAGMVEERDPKQVSLLGAILNQLTTYQANSLAPAKSGG